MTVPEAIRAISEGADPTIEANKLWEGIYFNRFNQLKLDFVKDDEGLPVKMKKDKTAHVSKSKMFGGSTVYSVYTRASNKLYPEYRDILTALKQEAGSDDIQPLLIRSAHVIARQLRKENHPIYKVDLKTGSEPQPSLAFVTSVPSSKPLAEKFAQAIANVLDAAYIPGLIKKTSETQIHTLANIVRHKVAETLFEPTESANGVVEGKHIVVVDDFMTKASTMSNMIRQFKSLGAASVTGVTLFKYSYKKEDTNLEKYNPVKATGKVKRHLGMKVIIAGSRKLEDYKEVVKAVEASGFNIVEVVSGKAPGADTLGERWAKEHDVPVKGFPSDWKRYGKMAGPRRNTQMAKYADALIAIPKRNLPNIGTNNMIFQAKRKGLQVYVHEAP